MPTILFETIEAACDAAYMLRGDWDKFNGVTVQKMDIAALNLVANQVQSDYCRSGAFCQLERIHPQTINEEVLIKYTKYAQKYSVVSTKFIFSVHDALSTLS